jgi:CRISPR-associated endonuclease/helicase Cas3
LQAAGRCNRHGELPEPQNVYVVNIAGENLTKLPDIKRGADITLRLFNDGETDINVYYRHYLYEQRHNMDYPIAGGGTVYDLLSQNLQGCRAYQNRKNEEKVELRPAMRSAADAFYVIERGRRDVVVPYGGSAALLDRYCAARDLGKKRALLRQLGRYSVSLYQYQADELYRRHALAGRDGVTILSGGLDDENGFYHNAFGLCLDSSPEFLFV